MALLAGFASGRVTMKGESIKHLPSTPVKTISQSGSMVKSKVAKKVSKKTIAHQLAEEKPHTKIPDSEIRPENIISGSPLYIPFK